MAKRPIDSRIDFLSPLSCIAGLGPKRVAALKESGMETVGDLLYYFPRRYIDRSTIVPIATIGRYREKVCTVAGTITRTRMEPGRRSRLRIQLTDESGGTLEALWFQGITFLRSTLQKGGRLLLTGKVGFFGAYQMVHPLMETLSPSGKDEIVPFLPVYPLSMAMREVHFQQKSILKAVRWVLKTCTHFPQILPSAIETQRGFPSLIECLTQMHMPQNPAGLAPFRARLHYEELYQRALTLRWSKREFDLPGRSLTPGDLPGKMRDILPFQLTDAQEEAIVVLFRDAATPRRMHRLLQGDVGCGKTIVALFACLPALNAGLQVAWLTPTEALADQTYALLSRWLGRLGFATALLKSGITAAARRDILAGTRNGTVGFVVGTQALLQPSVTFRSLGMIVIDEQHKFGAGQRLAMQRKDAAADFLLMSATPIPQTLAQTLYSDLDIVTIRALPAGRQPIGTHIVGDDKREGLFDFVRTRIAQHDARLFYIAARIDEGDEDDGDGGVRSVAEVYAHLRAGELKDIPMGLAHGRLSSGEKERVLGEFAEGRLKILVATTVVEVGIDVPAATIMIIENPEMFGLSQLHQLRGRVGRGAQKGYCFLLSTKLTDEKTARRLKEFCRVHDGFRLAELDLHLRGPGEMAGNRQTGWEDFHFVDIVRDAALFCEIQREIEQLLEK
jgi:ATP-dependent DNA helicase RecG